MAYFITIEGIEGVGKSTALQFICKQLDAAKIPYILTREPGGTEIADTIRQLILAHYHEKMSADTELLLYFASRAQNIAQNIKPALAHGKWVICDRFTDSSYAYQGGGRNIPEERIAILENWVHATLQPDLTFLLDAPAEVGLNRIKSREIQDRIEQEKGEFFTRVRKVYLERAKQYPQRFKIIDASASVGEVEKQIAAVLMPLLKKRNQ